jgi:phospholipid-binding lipoprotein MlaA
MRMAKTPDAARTLRALSGGVLLAAAFALSGCATGPDRKPGDPLEPMNREIFKFNDAADRYVARPIATGYVKVTPAPLRTAISSFFSNIGDVGNFANNLLQLKITDATEDLMRIVINSTFITACRRDRIWCCRCLARVRCAMQRTGLRAIR